VSQTKEIIRSVRFNLRREDTSGGPRRFASKIVLVNHSHITDALPRQGARNGQTDDAAANNDHF
jgi:hypothetical protein